jgi:hypothetical protein
MTEIIEYINIFAVSVYCVSLIMIGKYYFINNKKTQSKKNIVNRKLKNIIFYKNIRNNIDDLNARINEVKFRLTLPRK